MFAEIISKRVIHYNHKERLVCPGRNEGMEVVAKVGRMQIAGLFHSLSVRGQRNLIAAIDTHLIALKQDKNFIYYQALERWIDVGRRGLIPLWLKYLVASAAFLLVLSFIIIHILRSRVHARTCELIEKNRALMRESEERLQAEAALRESESGLRIILADKLISEGRFDGEEFVWHPDGGDVQTLFLQVLSVMWSWAWRECPKVIRAGCLPFVLKP